MHHLQDKCGSWKSPLEEQKLAQSLVVRDRVVGWNIRKATRSDSPSSKNREEARDRKSDTKKNELTFTKSLHKLFFREIIFTKNFHEIDLTEKKTLAYINASYFFRIRYKAFLHYFLWCVCVVDQGKTPLAPSNMIFFGASLKSPTPCFEDIINISASSSSVIIFIFSFLFWTFCFSNISTL